MLVDMVIDSCWTFPEKKVRSISSLISAVSRCSFSKQMVTPMDFRASFIHEIKIGALCYRKSSIAASFTNRRSTGCRCPCCPASYLLPYRLSCPQKLCGQPCGKRAMIAARPSPALSGWPTPDPHHRTERS